MGIWKGGTLPKSLILLVLLTAVVVSAFGQTPPGKLSAAHAKLEGAENCQKCHTTGKAVGSGKCLACHPAVAKRIEIKKGVHREVSGDCEVCHVEHQGVDVDLRPLDKKDFNHKEETGFALTGNHAALGGTCERCHKTRSFMALTPACSTCHKDPQPGGDEGPLLEVPYPRGMGESRARIP